MIGTLKDRSTPVARANATLLHGFLVAVTAIAVAAAPWGRAPAFSALTLTLWVFCALFLALDRPKDPLSPANTTVLLYAGVFALGPLWTYSRTEYRIWYLGESREELTTTAAALALVAFFGLLAGYLAATLFASRRRAPEAMKPDLSRGVRTRLLLCSIGVGALGTASYAMLIIQAGGLGYFLNYSGGRSDIFAGVFGGWFWGAHLVFAALGLFSVAMAGRHPWAVVAAAISIAAMFVPLQGRDVVIAPLYCALIFYHWYRRHVGWRALIVGVALVLTLSAFLGAFRQSNKWQFFNNPVGFTLGFAYGLSEHLGLVVSENIEQLDMVMVAERYVQQNDRHVGPLVLMAWAKPIDRYLLGNSIPTTTTGKLLDRLIYPEHVGWNTAVSPSLLGELLISLGWAGMIVGMVLYGAVLGRLTRWYYSSRGSPALLAAYPIVVYFFAKMLIDGTVHLFRPLVIFSAVGFCSFLVSRTPKGPALVRATT